MVNKTIKSKLRYTIYLICKVIILIMAAFLLTKTLIKHKYDYQHAVSFIQWLGSISLFFLAVEEIVIDFLTLLGKQNLLRHTPALFYIGFNNTGINKKRLSELSRFGIIWRIITLLLAMCLCISIILFGYSGAVTRYSYGDYDSAVFLLFVIIGGLLMLTGVFILLYKLLFPGR
ncbi:MAG: hypothetical protein JSV22_12625 [Bacteroidales bacterium]|nr:MAG: hypothetical protein JSV22_12625 [Bacteroidales bacterium]